MCKHCHSIRDAVKVHFQLKKPFQVFLRLFERLLRLFNFELLYCSPGSVDVLGGCCAMCKHCHSIRDAVKVHFQLKNPSQFSCTFLRDYYAFSILSFYTVLLGLLMFWGGCCAMCKHCHSIRCSGGLLCNVQALSFHQRCCKSTFSAKKPFQVFLCLFESLYAFSIFSFYTVLLGLLMFWGVAVQCASIVIPSEML